MSIVVSDTNLDDWLPEREGPYLAGRFRNLPKLILIASWIACSLAAASAAPSDFPTQVIAQRGHEGARSVAISANGRIAASNGWENSIKIWDVRTGRLIRDLVKLPGGTHNYTRIISLSPDGRRLLSDQNGYKIWDTETGKSLINFDDDEPIISPDGKMVISVGKDGNYLAVWDADSGILQRSIKGHSAAITAVAMSSNSEVLASASKDKTIRLWEVRSGKQLHIAKASGNVDALMFSPTGRTILVMGEKRSSTLLETDTGREILSLKPAGSPYSSELGSAFIFSQDGKTLFVNDENQINLWSVETGQRIRSISFPIITQYDVQNGTSVFEIDVESGASVKKYTGAKDILGISQDESSIGVSTEGGGWALQLLGGELTQDFAGTAAELVSATSQDGSLFAYSVNGEVFVRNIKSWQANAACAEITEQIKAIEFSPNQRQLLILTRDDVHSSLADDFYSLRICDIEKKTFVGPNYEDIVRGFSLSPDSRQLVAGAYNARNLIASIPARVAVNSARPVDGARPRLFVLAIGVNDYWDTRLNLNFAVPDARAVAAAFQKIGQQPIYDSAHIRTVLNEGVTRGNLEKAFKELATQVHPSDVFVLFTAGHGRTLEGHYHFIPYDFRYRDESSYAQGGISQEQWQQWISPISARKSILIYDTCESGTLTAEQSAVRGLGPVEEQAIAIEKLKRATGRTILAAATDTKPALEGYKGHGVFSYALLESLEKGRVNQEGLIDVLGLISFVDEEVPTLSFQAFKQRQIPQTKFVGSNFAVAKPIAALDGGSVAAESAAMISSEPTHVVLVRTQVRESAGETGSAVAELTPGAKVALVETRGGWALVAREGKRLGYVEATALAGLH
jgi:WD40 repeat protein/uncharacterized caspase-like protein